MSAHQRRIRPPGTLTDLVQVLSGPCPRERDDCQSVPMCGPRAPAAVHGKVLYSCLDPHQATPLEPSIRGFMESRFRAGLGEVLVHTGPAAANLCATLGARAFAWGRNIAFAAGHYDPSSAGKINRKGFRHTKEIGFSERSKPGLAQPLSVL